MDFDQAAAFVENWLENVSYGREPSTEDGVEKSNRVYCEDWGRIKAHGFGAFVAIEPEWLVFGK